ncbi:MAG: tRNA (N(6)-L-threonylcarbamoyladenosine(37)-C(2))-methylthiotransferase MtaB, partial [Halanaerobiales bacterium]|nr:tRNA (N(6)-L-threonylcarbamoyladenosine(37)-C(2))-methylthiotransferase MtaB [Halanaerobiales bacterium]
MKTVAFYTLGCKVNHYETEVMIDQFSTRGYTVKEFNQKADIYIINSCTVTNQAASKSRKYARRAKRKNQDAIVVMVGCYPQVEEKEVKSIKEIDYILGTSGKNNVVKLIEKKLKTKKNKSKLLKDSLTYQNLADFEEMSINNLSETTRAYIKIQEGCNQFCSYCIIPYARGKLRSRKPNNIYLEVKKLVNEQRVKEIVLTGIHLGAYGLENNEENKLVELIKLLSGIEGLKRIRLSSIEVTEVNDKLLNLMKSNKKLCPHLHLPLQSGSDYILEKMNRPYTTDQYQKRVRYFKNSISDLSVTTDLIVGFPNETIKEFKETYDFIKNLGFSRLHVFPFSKRKNTPAYDMKPRVKGNIKRKHAARLRLLNKRIMSEFNSNYINQTKKVIIEDNTDYESGLYT